MFPYPLVTPTTTAKRKPHSYVDDPEAAGTCKECHLPAKPPNQIHNEEAVAAHEADIAERQEQARLRTGER